MSTLHDRLAELAADVTATPAPVDDLWRRGRRLRSRQRRGTALTLGCATLALVALAALTWQRSVPDIEPASAPAGLPDRLYRPSPWLDGTDEAGPLGRLAAVVPATRGSWTGSRDALVGVSAVTGEYRFLDLPRVADLRAVALSPDGRHLAYWERAGLAVYDTETGAVRRHPIDAPLGVEPRQPVWAGSGTVAASVEVYTERRANATTARLEPPLVWSLTDPAPAPLPGADGRAAPVAGGQGFVLLAGPRRFEVVDPTTGERRRSVELDSNLLMAGPVPDPTGTSFAVIAGGTLPGPVSVGGTGPTVGPPAVGIEGWADTTHPVVRTRPDLGEPGSEVVVVGLDATSEVLLRDAGGESLLAADLLAEPTVPGVRPPDPADPRSVAVLGALVVLGTGRLVVVRRRRVRP